MDTGGQTTSLSFSFLGCFFFCLVFFAFSLLPLCRCAFCFSTLALFFFLWSFWFAAFLKFGWCRDWFLIFQWNNNNIVVVWTLLLQLELFSKKPLISVFSHTCIHFNQPHNISFPPFFLVHLLVQRTTGTSLSFLMGFAPSLPPSLSSPPQIRYRKDKVRSKLTPTFPLVYAVKDLSNGCAIASVLHYYCSSLLPLEGTPAHTHARTHACAQTHLMVKCSISFYVRYDFGQKKLFAAKDCQKFAHVLTWGSLMG